MEAEQMYMVISSLMEYINPKERELALFNLLDYLYNEDIVDLNDLKDYANSEEDDWTTKKINSYIKANGLEEDEEEVEEW